MGVALAAATLGWSRRALAAGAPVPANLQADLVAKAAKYDRNLRRRAGSSVELLVVRRARSADSESVARIFEHRIEELGTIAGLPVRITHRDYEGSPELLDMVKSSEASILFLSTELGSEVAQIGRALQGTSLLSVGAAPRYIPEGMVLGFSLEGGKPKILVNLAQAKAQSVDLHASFLKLARLVG